MLYVTFFIIMLIVVMLGDIVAIYDPTTLSITTPNINDSIVALSISIERHYAIYRHADWCIF